MAILLILLLCYMFLCLVIFIFQGKVIFFARKFNENSPSISAHKHEEITIEVDGFKLHGWLLNPGNDKLIIYYGGSAEEVSGRVSELALIKNCTSLVLNYRGYGKSEGSPTEKALFDDALKVFDKITAQLNIPPEKVILLGWSLGTGVAVHVASRRNVSKVILTTPFDSIINVFKKYVPILPLRLLIRHPFDSVFIADKIKAPVLMFLAENDKTIPFQSSINLANHITAPLNIITIKDAGHNDIHCYGQYYSAINDFINND